MCVGRGCPLKEPSRLFTLRKGVLIPLVEVSSCCCWGAEDAREWSGAGLLLVPGAMREAVK